MGTHMYTRGLFMSMYGINHHNIVVIVFVVQSLSHIRLFATHALPHGRLPCL